MNIGWVPDTELGDGISSWVEEDAPDTPRVSIADSASEMVKLIISLSTDDSGSFFNYNGDKIPW